MSWVDDQVKERIKADDEVLKESIVDLSSVVLNKNTILKLLNENEERTKSALEDIFRYYKIKILDDGKDKDNNKKIEDSTDLDTILSPYGIMYRDVTLNKNWYKDATGPLIATTKSGETVTLMPGNFFGYYYVDPKTGKKVSINRKTSKNLDENAICFYKPFPQKSLVTKDLVFFIINSLEKRDIIFFVLVTLLVQIIGTIYPYISNLLFSKVVPSENINILIPFSFLLMGIVFSSKLISISRGILEAKIGTKLSLSVESATMAKIMTLPTTFFSNHSSGNLSSRMRGIKKLCTILSDMLFGNLLIAVCSLVYLIQMYHFAKSMLLPSLILIAIQLFFTVFSSVKMTKISKVRTDRSAKLYSLVLVLLSGIQKIKLCGAEKRAFAKWAKMYKNYADAEYNPSILVKVIPAITKVIPVASTVVLCYISGISNVFQTNYYSFMLSFSIISGAILALSKFAEDFSEIKPLINLVSPILRTIPECSESKKVINKLNGTIELNQVSFRYPRTSRNILDNISLKISAGQYVAIVGRTGCGKSTLMRLLLGFEKPQRGAIYYDGVDMDKLDLKSLRRNIGSVMQNGRLMQGDIYSNIVAAAPWLKLEDAWNAARLAGVEDEIKEMPMGMFTLVSEGSGGLSGGQKQRIMIARALISSPDLLMFDEATSALDNITQAIVVDTLAKMDITRIVIAHRLSTIKHCDRIVYLHEGKVAEQGTFDELMELNGRFAELARRQIV